MICVNKKGKDHLKVGYVRAVQAFDNKIKVCFEDGTECKLQAANNFEHLEDGKRKRGQGEEDNLQKSAAAMKFKANQSEEEKQAFRNKDAARKRAKRQEHSQESKDVIRARNTNRHQLARETLSEEIKEDIRARNTNRHQLARETLSEEINEDIRAQDRHHHQLARETLNEESTAVKKKKKRKKLAYNFDTTRIPLTYYVRPSVCQHF